MKYTQYYEYLVSTCLMQHFITEAHLMVTSNWNIQLRHTDRREIE